MRIQLVTPHAPPARLLDRMTVLQNLSGLRQEWEVAADGDSLISVSASVGLMLLDVATQLGLSPDEQIEVLGHRLYKEASAKSRGNSA
jgi:hypothetical protein